MDLSLDDYFQNKIGKYTVTKPSGILNRLGPKISPARNRKQNSNTQFKVTGLGNIKHGGQQQPKKVVKTITVGDARNKLNRNKSQDLRTKVNNLKARKTDAREKIRARQVGSKSGNQAGSLVSAEQKVVVTGLGKPFKGLVNQSGVTEVSGMLTKTVRTTPQTNKTGPKKKLFKTITGPGASKGTGAISVRVTPRKDQQKTDTLSEQPKVRIQNDHYVPPQQQQPQRQPHVVQQPQYSGFEYTPPATVVTQPYVEPQHSVPIMEPVLQQVIQPAYQQSYTQSASYSAVQSANPFSDGDSSVSGYRVIVTNLHPIVSQDDLVELFGSIGALKKARLMKPGMAEVVYMSREDALSACKKYHMRELDGQPMQVNMTSLSKMRSSPQSSRQAPIKTSSPIFFSGSRKLKTKKPAKSPSPETIEDEVEGERGAPLRLGRDTGPGLSNMDMNLVHKALFKTRIAGSAPARPVTFTVKI